ncbi:NAD(P)-dependent oxidoreductase [Acidiphilium sp. AL]|uniref:NAD(P)-dependent oxidoreductase n=1 Tax=Acidiphilium iwatense TaxID=768198 RepID=A0ABS9DSC0_9PROT|nr:MULTISPECIES: NAD(P)-dependent oxidoreductase [Acidiphilium]MCF3945080.1 NAD(P)-dependent oxidoreductase [Acidiphilium iwatense]MCU4160575.1 NAD(P)-dependent oxidoreductase [Acidiphilium sp. AL]
MAKIAFIGLGVMGFPMAGHLASGGHNVTVYNRSPAKAEAWVKKHGGRSAPTPEAAARDCAFVFACVGNDDDLRTVTIGDGGAFAGMQPGSVFVDHTTASATVARELDAAARERKLGFLDAPVSGGQAGAESGKLTVMVGGDAGDFERARPAIGCFGAAISHIGPSGSGQLTKMVNQICVAGVVQGLAEGLHFAEAAGLDVAAVVGAISKGAAQSWQMENRWKAMVAKDFDFGFAVDWMRKDLGICLAQAHETGARLPVTALIDQFYADVQAMGGSRWDTSSLIARFGK